MESLPCWISKKQAFSSFLFLLLAFTITHIVINSNSFLWFPTRTPNEFKSSNDLYLDLDRDLLVQEFLKKVRIHRSATNNLPPELIINQTQVSITLATHLLSENPHSNVVFSPLSIHVALSVTAAGSKGETRDQILAFLKTNTTDDLNYLYSRYLSSLLADGGPDNGPQLSFANGLWLDETFSLKPSFKQVVDDVYKATSKLVDFQNTEAVTREVNLWAEKQTNGLIKQVINADDFKDDTVLIFTNALYFKGAWSKMFDRSKTKETDFHLLDGNKVQVPFMTSEEHQFVSEYKDFKVMGLPYSQGKDNRKFTMYVFLPKAKDGLQNLVEKMGSTPNFFERHIPRKKQEVEQFLIPKFKVSFGFEASDMLKELGLVLPFTNEYGITEMLDGQSLKVSAIHHKSFVEVNEEGTEAAAVTLVTVNSVCLKIDFVADHPFLFVIREDVTGGVLFMGQVINPLLG